MCVIEYRIQASVAESRYHSPVNFTDRFTAESGYHHLTGIPVSVSLPMGQTRLMQMNFKVPSMAPGSYPLVVTINGEKSNAAMVTIK